ncbi:hypothetical protein HMPREF1869_01792 [Bacteroidales bacterium KA00251]|nr:hypothetical protein HMPREF1869_01792 [Bacteroidales bacterium KA00251]
MQHESYPYDSSHLFIEMGAFLFASYPKKFRMTEIKVPND